MRRNMNPGFTFTPAIVRDLMDIEAARRQCSSHVTNAVETSYPISSPGTRLRLTISRQPHLDGPRAMRRRGGRDSA